MMTKLTREQEDIIRSAGDIKINAVAGSGKTTTIIEYAKTRPRESKILYLAFNKSVKLEAARKFSDQGLHNVKVETAHSLAYRHIVIKHRYKVRAQGYKTNEIVDLLNLKGNGEKHTEYVVATHINKLISYFCNSDKKKVHELDYLNTVTDPKAKNFVSSFYDYILAQARLLLSKMNSGEIAVTHDFYLKKFQLSDPRLYYDYILFDEGQDASSAMLDIFLKQKATKVIVGDTHQQIYGWRYAVNSLEKVDFKVFHLSTSFRFDSDIAKLATEVLNFKKHISSFHTVRINGKGNGTAKNVKAVIARTNLGLLFKAIEYVTEQNNVERIYFEGNINSYTYADEGASLYDVLNLYNNKRHLIRDKLIKTMEDLDELDDYINKTDDVQLSMMVDLVRAYGNKIPKIIKAIKEKHVENDDKSQAEMIFSTVHRCKGMEYDTVSLANDFLSEEKLRKICEDKVNLFDTAKLNEEINLLYVAITRTKNNIIIPEQLMPKNFAKSSRIVVVPTEHANEHKTSEVDQLKTKVQKGGADTGKISTIAKIKAKYTNAYKPWSAELDEELAIMFDQGVSLENMVAHFKRARGAIYSRINKLNLRNLSD